MDTAIRAGDDRIMMSRMDPESEYEALMYVVQRLTERFPGVTEDEIRILAAEEFQAYADAHVRDFIPVLVERGVRVRLTTGHAA